MKNFSFTLILGLVFVFSFCGPPTENREVMHSRAKTIADSMANLIRTALDEAKMPVATQTMTLGGPDPNAANTATTTQPAAGEATVK